MDRPIPGYYYDKEKKRYFKIAGAGSAAPSSAAYNTDNVKKRKIAEHKADHARKRQEKTKHLIKRSSALRKSMTGRRLLCETGVVDPELPLESWAAGLRDKDFIYFAGGSGDHGFDPFSDISRIMVNGDDTRSGLGVVYAGMSLSTCLGMLAILVRQACLLTYTFIIASNRSLLSGAYIPTDDEGRISFKNQPVYRSSHPIRGILSEHIRAGEVISLNYHKPSHTMVMADRRFRGYNRNFGDPRRNLPSVCTFAPTLRDESDADQADVDMDWGLLTMPPPSDRPRGEAPSWLLGETEVYEQFELDERAADVYSTRVAPAAHSGSLMLLATKRGLLELYTGVEDGCCCPKFIDMGPKYRDHEVLSGDYHPTNPNIVFAGRRDGRFFRIDRRTADRTTEGEHGEWKASSFSTGRYQYRGPASVAHLRALDEHQILAAGPTSAMAVYDVRWMQSIAGNNNNSTAGKGKQPQQQQQQQQQPDYGKTTPVVRMHEYKNTPHIDIGLDVAMGIGGNGGGVIAAAQDDGTLALFSLRTGKKLRAGDVDAIRAPNQGIIKAIQFATMPWEKEPSLFVGAGAFVRKYGFGTGKNEDEDEDD